MAKADGWRALRFEVSGANKLVYGGLGILAALDYVPFSKEGPKVFWCPAENIGNYYGSVSGWGYGWGSRWNYFKNKRWEYCGGGASSTYAYRSLNKTLSSNLYSIPYGPGRTPSYKIDLLGKFVAVIDACSNVPGTYSTTPSNVHNPHGGKRKYSGFNRLWYGGHVKWFNDPTCIWQYECSSDNTYYGNYTNTAWRKYDEE